MRRRPGIGGLETHTAARDQFRLLGQNVAKIKTNLMKEQLGTFHSQLEDFSRKHSSKKVRARKQEKGCFVRDVVRGEEGKRGIRGILFLRGE